MDKGSLLLQPGCQATDIAGNVPAAERTFGTLTAVPSNGSFCASIDILIFVAALLGAVLSPYGH